jgi:hypothetical protein
MKTKPEFMMDQFLLKCLPIPINYKFLWLPIFFVFIFLGGSASPQISFYVSPPLIEIQQIGGGTRNFTIEISNTGQEKIQVKTSFSDLSFDSEGKVELISKGTTPYSLTSWITTKIEEFIVLNPGEIKKIPLQVRVPRGERGGRYGVVVFEALPFNTPQGKITLGIRSGTLIFLTIPRTEEIKGIIDDVISTADGKEFKIIFKNNGNIHYETEGSLIIKNQVGKILHRIRFQEERPSLLLPQGKRELTISWDKKDPLLDGKYILEIRMSAWVGIRTLNLSRKVVEIEVKN